MLKMLLDPMGGIVITNDGNCILREVDVSHPAAKSMLELSRAQDEEVWLGKISVYYSHCYFWCDMNTLLRTNSPKVGDGTTSVIILTGEMLSLAEPFLSRGLHPTQIVNGYTLALETALETCDSLALVVDLNDRKKLNSLVNTCIGTKFSSRWGDKLVNMAVDAVMKIVNTTAQQKKEVDVKRYVRVEKVPGGELDMCQVLDGVRKPTEFIFSMLLCTKLFIHHPVLRSNR